MWKKMKILIERVNEKWFIPMFSSFSWLNQNKYSASFSPVFNHFSDLICFLTVCLWFQLAHRLNGSVSWASRRARSTCRQTRHQWNLVFLREVVVKTNANIINMINTIMSPLMVQSLRQPITAHLWLCPPLFPPFRVLQQWCNGDQV